MHVLVFHLGRDRYGLRTEQVTRVLPLLELKTIPGAPAWVAGLMQYRAMPIPVVDLSQLANGTTSQARFETRIILVDYHCPDGQRRPLGLIAEQVTATVKIDPAQLGPSGLAGASATWLGDVISGTEGILQLITIDQLLAPEIRALLFPDAIASAAC